MTFDIKSMKKNSKKAFADLTAKLEKESVKGNYSRDERYWSLTRDAAGNGSAVIRFTGAHPDDGENYFVKVIKNKTQGPNGKWYNELSRSTLGKDQKDPFAERKSELWNLSDHDDAPSRILAKTMERRQTWHYNIHIVKDPAAPENEGKDFLFSGTSTIADKINDAMFPPTDEFEQKESLNPFCFWEGANFVLRANPNYDKSAFTKPAPLFDTGDEAEDEKLLTNVLSNMYKLSDLISEDKFKSYDDLKKKLYSVLDLDNSGESNFEKSESNESKPRFAEEVETADEPAGPATSENDDEDTDMAAFKRMFAENE